VLNPITDRFTSLEKKPTGGHVFDLECVEWGIEHRLCPPRHPQTNGMVECFNGRISELTQQTRFAFSAELEITLGRYLTLYNHHIPQRTLNHQIPIQAIQKWQNKKPELFVKNVYDHTGLDKYSRNSTCVSLPGFILSPCAARSYPRSGCERLS